MAIGKAGAKNAAIFAAQIIARKEKGMARKLQRFKKKMAGEVIKENASPKGSNR
jgi:phosphoribosylcarboxyaminoimidazole (NCAIR) mutase